MSWYLLIAGMLTIGCYFTADKPRAPLWFVALACLVWPITTAWAIGEMAREKDRKSGKPPE